MQPMSCFNVREFIRNDRVVESTENGSLIICSAAINGNPIMFNSKSQAILHVSDSDGKCYEQYRFCF